jgi:hypothetical protein
MGYFDETELVQECYIDSAPISIDPFSTSTMVISKSPANKVPF